MQHHKMQHAELDPLLPKQNPNPAFLVFQICMPAGVANWLLRHVRRQDRQARRMVGWVGCETGVH